MNYERIKELPSDTQIIVSMKYIYSPEEITPEIHAYWMANRAEFIHQNKEEQNAEN
jgi:hypothetical protein